MGTSRPDEIEPRVIELARAKRLAVAGAVLRVVVESFVRDDEISIFGEAVVEGESEGAMPYRDGARVVKWMMFDRPPGTTEVEASIRFE